MRVVHQLRPLPHLEDPTLIVAFRSLRPAGETAGAAGAYLIASWGLEPLATIDVEPFLNLGEVQPLLQDDGVVGKVQWPAGVIAYGRPRGADRDFILLICPEPNYRWLSFLSALEGFLAFAGVRTAVCLRSVAGPAPHTRPAIVGVLSSDRSAAYHFGVPHMEAEDSALEIGSLMMMRMEDAGCQTAELWSLEPDYFPAVPNAGAALGLIQALDRAFGSRTDVDELERTAAMQHCTLEERVRASGELGQRVESLEYHFDRRDQGAPDRRAS